MVQDYGNNLLNFIKPDLRAGEMWENADDADGTDLRGMKYRCWFFEDRAFVIR